MLYRNVTEDDIQLLELLQQHYRESSEIQMVNSNIANEGYILITTTLPKEADEQPQQLKQNKSQDDERKKGLIYMTKEEITEMDNQIANVKKTVGFITEQLMYAGKMVTITSPFYVLGQKYPIGFTRQWWYYTHQPQVRYLMMHQQASWKVQLKLRVADQMQAYKWEIKLQQMNDDLVNQWVQLIKQMGEIWEMMTGFMEQKIQKAYDTEQSNYKLNFIENAWFNNSRIRQFYAEHNSGIRKYLMTFINIHSRFYYTQQNDKELFKKMQTYQIHIFNSPSFELKESIGIACWLCYDLVDSREELYIHHCKKSHLYVNHTIKDHIQKWTGSKNK